ncbi:MAG: adenylate/guanylate cyclase domain-containing protein [Tepidiformaceae bacterium]
MPPETRYARSGDVHIAYQVVGDGPFDLLFVPGMVSHLEIDWEEPSYAAFLRRMASFSRLIKLDKRGTGLSDRGPLFTMEQRMDDVRAVMDDAGSDRAALFGISEGGPMCALFAATYPERTSALVLYGAVARNAWAPDFPWGRTPESFEALIADIEGNWGGAAGLAAYSPSRANDESTRDWWRRWRQQGASPGAAIALVRMNAEIDIRNLVPLIRVPTLILHRTDDAVVPVEQGRYLAGNIPGARWVELPGGDHLPYFGDSASILAEVESFLGANRGDFESDRVLATVLFTDIVDSTPQAAAVGDRRWRDLLETHNATFRRELVRFRGREVNSTGDGFVATFDGPARAIRCAQAVCAGVRLLGIEVRAGLHAGEVVSIGDDITGIAVNVGARVAAKARPGEVLVSGTVKDLVAGSGISFRERGKHLLKGVPGEWPLYAAE